MTTPCLIHVHIGNNIPDYIFDNLYQTLLINNYLSKIYVLIEDSQIESFNNKIIQFNLNNYYNYTFFPENIIQTIPLSILNDELFQDENFKKYQEILNTKFTNMTEFRDGFWVSTSARFFYIYIFMKIFNLSNVFHIENDVMLYKRLTFLYEYIKEEILENKEIDKICMIQDSTKRVIPSLLLFPNVNCLYELTLHMVKTLDESSYFINDMNLLGTFTNKYLLSIDPSKCKKTENLIFDGAAIGQFLGGVDTKNLKENEIPDKDLILINNPKKGFINETSLFKPNTCHYIKNIVHIDNLKIHPKVFSCKLKNDGSKGANNKLYNIANLHIHSKQLYQFSSILDITYNDIISGDKVISLCDFVILTKEIYNYHKNLDKFAKDVIIINDFNSINYELLNDYLRQTVIRKNSNCINLFIYTHMLDIFTQCIFPFIDKNIKYNFYIHNSDHDINDNHLNLINDVSVNHIFAQNINTSKMHDKLSLLPLGLANSMWPHGNAITLYNTIKNTYKYKKTKNIYVNINSKTFHYRSIVLNEINKYSNFEISKGTSFEEYLNELASHRFCLCVRGNGIDTHRFWESLYLGVIPVIINNKYTKCETFIEYLKQQNIPFYEIKSDDLAFDKKHRKEFFNETLYQNCINKLIPKTFYNLDCLKISHYAL